jgi:nucleoside-diphosphate-sugar epimerase
VILEMEQLFEAHSLPVIFFEPTLFMNNLQGSWIRNQIAQEGLFRYCHKPAMEADWICLEDVARYMVAALDRPDLIGRKIRIGGPDRLKAKDVIAILAEAVGREVVHEYITPRDFAQGLWDLYKDMDEYEANGGNLPRGKTEEQYVGDIDRFYTFCNDSPLRPFLIDQDELERTISLPRTSMRDWALAQDWH